MTPLPIPNFYAVPVPGDCVDVMVDFDVLRKGKTNLIVIELPMEGYPSSLEDVTWFEIPNGSTLIGTVTASTMDFDAGAYITYNCLACGGDGKETCNNPDHGFISAMGGAPKNNHGSRAHDVGRLGCPVCGHDPDFKVYRFNFITGKREQPSCDECHGAGKMSYEECQTYMDNNSRVDEYIETPTEAIRSALAAAQIYFQNPLGEEPKPPKLSDQTNTDFEYLMHIGDEYKHELQQWQAAEKNKVQKVVIIKVK